jgi:hypothetical protein
MKKHSFASPLLITGIILLMVSACVISPKQFIPGSKVGKGTSLAIPSDTAEALVDTPEQAEFSPTPIIWTATPIVITATPQLSLTPEFTATVPQPTAASVSATATSLPSLTPASNTQVIKIYLVAIGDNGATGTKIGCDDSLIPVDVGIPPTTGVLRAALSELLAIESEFYGSSGLYNALYQSDLEIGDLTVINGLARIYLTGDLMLGGVCDHPRVEAQLNAIALQFSTVSSVEIFINSIPLKDVLSLK